MDFKFADVGEGIVEGEIVRWLVSEGDEIEENKTIVEIETDKAIVDIPSPCDGIIKKIPYKEGDRIEVGETLAVIDPDDADDESNTVVGKISEEAEVLGEEDTSEQSTDESEVLATPKTRKLAKELGVDLDNIKGTGSGGRITAEDVRAASRSDDHDNIETSTENDEYGKVEVKSVRGVRKRIAERTEKSHQKVPQVTHMDEIDVTDLISTLSDYQDDSSENNSLTLTPLFVRSLVESLKNHPALNSTYDGENEQINYKKYYNVGLTVDTDSGLIVPVLKNLDNKNVDQISQEIQRLARRARERALNLNELQGATFTLTNIGFIGGTWSTPQVNHPQAAILATGRVKKTPAVVDGKVVSRSILPVSLSFDHRILDGADAARFINDFANKLSTPDFFNL